MMRGEKNLQLRGFAKFLSENGQQKEVGKMMEGMRKKEEKDGENRGVLDWKGVH